MGNARVVGCSRQPKIGDLGIRRSIVEEDIGRLDIAVDQAVGVSGGQTACNVAADLDRFRQRRRLTAVEAILERTPVNKLHDQVRPVPRFFHPVNVDNVFVADGGGGTRLATRIAPGPWPWQPRAVREP